MNSVQIQDQKIELVYQNGDVIHVDFWGIKELNFDTSGSVWTFNPSRKEMLTAERIVNFKLVLDVENTKMFWTTNRNRDTDSVKEDGKNCVQRMRDGFDLSILTLNGRAYLMPIRERTDLGTYEKPKYGVNDLQKISLVKDPKTWRHTLTIEVEILNEQH